MTLHLYVARRFLVQVLQIFACDLRMAADAGRYARRRPRICSLWRRLYRSITDLALECRRRATRPLGCHWRCNLSRRSRVDPDGTGTISLMRFIRKSPLRP